MKTVATTPLIKWCQRLSSFNFGYWGEAQRTRREPPRRRWSKTNSSGPHTPPLPEIREQSLNVRPEDWVPSNFARLLGHYTLPRAITATKYSSKETASPPPRENASPAG